MAFNDYVKKLEARSWQTLVPGLACKAHMSQGTAEQCLQELMVPDLVTTLPSLHLDGFWSRRYLPAVSHLIRTCGGQWCQCVQGASRC